MIKPRLRHETALGPSVLRVTTWRGNPNVLQIASQPGRSPTTGDVAALVERARRAACARLLTTALTVEEARPFLEAGFAEREQLHLLRHRLDRIPPPPAGIRTRRARGRDRVPVLTVDRAAFEDFWRLDRRGLADACAATPSSRFRVIDRDGVAGYAITGRSGAAGYLQRLAVHPAHRRRGIATALVADALWWVHRRGGTSVLVNTQRTNDTALALYRHLGFERQPDGLRVLEFRLTPDDGG